jgi:uncharacterized protein YggE
MEIDNKKVGVVALAIIAFIAIGMWVFSPTDVVVTGVGKVSVPANSATFNVTVNAINDNANDALKDLRAKVEAIKNTLTEINVAASDISETQVTLTPAAAVVASAKGFQAMTTLSVKSTNVRMISDIVVNMYASGATLVSQPVVSVEDQEKLEAQALKEALKKAKDNLGQTVSILHPIRKVVAIEQASSGNTATTTKAVEGSDSEFEVVRAVSVTYRVW